MKKIIVLFMIIMFSAGILFISHDTAFARRKDKEEGPKLIYTFKNDQEMTEFEQLYISKQATYGRMGVLQAYFSMEQNNLAMIDRQMEEKFGFKMDPSKMYDLNRDAKEIKEVGVAPGVQAQTE